MTTSAKNISGYLIDYVNSAIRDCIAGCGYNYTVGGQTSFREGNIINIAINGTVVTVTCVILVDTEGTIDNVVLFDINNYVLVQTDATTLNVSNLTSGVVVFNIDLWQYINDSENDYYDSSATYAEGDLCIYEAGAYKSKVDDNTGNTPTAGTSDEYWDFLNYVSHKAEVNNGN